MRQCQLETGNTNYPQLPTLTMPPRVAHLERDRYIDYSTLLSSQLGALVDNPCRCGLACHLDLAPMTRG